jgi:predicted  nucleic acid-binding Zn-ribbon protein
MTDEELKLLVQSNALAIQAIGQRIDSNSRAIQAMIEQRATDRLEHEERIVRLEDVVLRLTRIEEAQNRMLSSIDEDRPTVLRKLTAIENKIDQIIENRS